MNAYVRMLLIFTFISMLFCSCDKQPSEIRFEFDNNIHIESIPDGALVMFFPGTAEAPTGESQSIGETPLVIERSSLGTGRILIAFRTKRLQEQLSRIPELHEIMSEFKKEMTDRRSSFAQSSYAALFYSGQYFDFPSEATQALVAEDGELIAFGPVFDYKIDGLIWNRYVAWALPTGKRPSCLFTLMPQLGTYVAANSTESSYKNIPTVYRQEARECLSRCGYYAWIGKEGAQKPYCALTAQVMAEGSNAIVNQSWSPGRK